MRSFTDIFILLAVVINLVIVLVGLRVLTSLPVQQYSRRCMHRTSKRF
jgi:hypothetical protein